jgi:beta-glucosidase
LLQDNFRWGVAAASYQIEGAAYEDGKGLSIWDVFCRQPGKIQNGQNADIACDHYHRYQEDIALMADLGVQAYRFSVSWPRVLPEGIGIVNEKGLSFYDRLVDALLNKNIEPWLTIFHWDYPYELYCKGGWLNSDSSDWFSEYTRVLVDKFADRVTHWITQNEIQCFIGVGHQTGEHAPGVILSFRDFLLAAHHALLAHGKAVQVIRAGAKRPVKVGAAPVGVVNFPATNEKRDVEAARESTFAVSEKHYWNNSWYSDPMILGKYPQDGLKLFESELPAIKQNDLRTICQPLDFYGANIYFGSNVKSDGSGNYKFVKTEQGAGFTATGWSISPEALYWGPKFLYERYHLPIVITENGMACHDWIHLDGKVHDPQRIDFLMRYISQYKKAIAAGVPALGYFLWSFIDNFEWAQGFKQRFGIIYNDYATQKRIPKDSAFWYRDVIASNGKIV